MGAKKAISYQYPLSAARVIQALDYHFGHIEDLIFDEASRAIRYLVADARNWWPGKRVLLSPLWISDVKWQEVRVHVDFDRDTVKRGPVYNPNEPITQEYEAKLFEHYHGNPIGRRRRDLSDTRGCVPQAEEAKGVSSRSSWQRRRGGARYFLEGARLTWGSGCSSLVVYDHILIAVV